MEAGQRSDDVSMLLVEMLEGSVFLKHVHALPLVEDHPDWAVLEHQPGFSIQKYGHLLMNHPLD